MRIKSSRGQTILMLNEHNFYLDVDPSDPDPAVANSVTTAESKLIDVFGEEVGANNQPKPG